jgi:SAM-dependent methyltransferase
MALSRQEPPRRCPACEGRSWEELTQYKDPLGTTDTVFTIIRCKTCGVMSYEPLPDEATLSTYYPTQYYSFQPAPTRSGWSGRAKQYLDDLHLGIRRNWLLAAFLLPLLWFKEALSYARFLRALPRGRLLDVGCGDGAFLAKAKRMGFECYGMEPGGGDERWKDVDGIRIFHCSLREFEEHEGFFDYVTLNHVFEHLLDPEESLRKIRSLLRPGGRVLIRIPQTDHFVFRWFLRHWCQLEVPRHVYLNNARNFELLTRRMGFRTIRVIPESLPPLYQYLVKDLLFGLPYATPHWTDSSIFTVMLLPVCALLKLTRQPDSIAVWLTPATPRDPKPTAS